MYIDDGKKLEESYEDMFYNLNLRVRKYIENNCPFVLELAKKCQTYVIGGVIRDISLNKVPRDIDVFCLSCNDIEIKEIIDTYGLVYRKNSFGGYKIEYNRLEIDLWNSTTVDENLEYNADGMLYSISENKIIFCGFLDALENGLKLVNKNNHHPDKVKRLKRKRKLMDYLKKFDYDIS